jgi:hypothetical protein
VVRSPFPAKKTVIRTVEYINIYPMNDGIVLSIDRQNTKVVWFCLSIETTIPSFTGENSKGRTQRKRIAKGEHREIR